jgi:UDP-glucose 6-dehydrogenase
MCLPKDMEAFIAHFEALGLEESAHLLRADREFNKKILAEQGLTIEDVTGHDKEHIERVKQKMEAQKNSSSPAAKIAASFASADEPIRVPEVI